MSEDKPEAKPTVDKNDAMAARKASAERAAKALESVRREVKMQLWVGVTRSSQLHKITSEWIGSQIEDIAKQIIDEADSNAIDVARLLAVEVDRFVMAPNREVFLSQAIQRVMGIVDVVDGKYTPPPPPPKPAPAPRKKRPDEVKSIEDHGVDKLNLPRTVIDSMEDKNIHTISDLNEFDASTGLYTEFGDSLANEILDAVDEYRLKLLKEAE